MNSMRFIAKFPALVILSMVAYPIKWDWMFLACCLACGVVGICMGYLIGKSRQ